MSLVNESDADLLLRWQDESDEDAFAALVDRYRNLVSGVCRRHSRSPQDAEDAYQAVFFLLARDASTIRDARRLPGWLLTVAMRIAVKIRCESPVIPVECDSIPGSSPSPLQRLSETHQSRALDEEIAELPDRFRQPIVLHFLEGKTYEETAVQLGTTVGSVRTRLRTGTRTLRQRLVQRGVSVAGAVALVASARRADAAFTLDHTHLHQQLVDGALPRGIDPDTTFTSLLTNGSLYGVTTMKVSISLALTGMLAIGAALVPIIGHGEGEQRLTTRISQHRASGSTFVAMPAEQLNPSQSSSNDPTPSPQTSEWVGGSEEVYAKFDAALETVESFSFLDEPLESVVQVLAEQFEIPILIDRRSLDQVGLSPDEPITIDLPNVSLESALNLMLPMKDLTYQVQHEVLMITTPETVDANPLVRTYWIDEPIEATPVMEAIQASVDPNNWNAAGGSSTITSVMLGSGKRAGLIVATSYTTHRRIDALLDSLFPERTQQGAGQAALSDGNGRTRNGQPNRDDGGIGSTPTNGNAEPFSSDANAFRD